MGGLQVGTLASHDFDQRKCRSQVIRQETCERQGCALEQSGNEGGSNVEVPRAGDFRFFGANSKATTSVYIRAQLSTAYLQVKPGLGFNLNRKRDLVAFVDALLFSNLGF